MFNVGPMELLVLAIVGLIVLGPDKLPGLARDAARMLRTLRDLAQGARTQLRDELGPEFADIDLRNLNPRTAITRAVLGDDWNPAGGLGKLDPAAYLRDAIAAADEPPPAGVAAAPVSLDEPTPAGEPVPMGEPVSLSKPAAAAGPSGGAAPYDPDTT